MRRVMSMRVWFIAAGALAACGDAGVSDPVAACGLAATYRTRHWDCGPPFPEDWPDSSYPCYWTVSFGLDAPDGFGYCYTDFCTSGRFRCGGTTVIGTANDYSGDLDPPPMFYGTLDVETGMLRWEGLDYQPY